ncbi:MAG: nucleoside kinase [Hungatella sp.]|nr:nucleoside kinase [Hungatella sp.]
MAKVKIGDQVREYQEGTPYLEIAKEYQGQYSYDILLVSVNGKLAELQKKVSGDCSLTFITAAEKPGSQTYQRTTKLIMLKAFYEVVGRENVEKITVKFSAGKGLFVQPSGNFTLNQQLLGQVKEKMREYVEKKLPIEKRSLNTEEAIELFTRLEMYDKAQLFKFRRVSRVNVYRIGEFEDYFYGYMAPDTGYIRLFDLIPFEDGFVLLIPDAAAPDRLPEFRPSQKLFQVLKESSQWGEKMRIPNIGALNQEISRGRANELILIQEALQEKKIGQIAEMIADQPDKKFVMIAGPSSSGKTTFSHRLSIQLQALGMRPHPIAVDNYFVDREKSPRDKDGNYDFEALECVDVPLFNQDMVKLLSGETVELPRFNFVTGKREYKGDTMKLGKEDILVIEGIHCLNDKFSYSLPKESKFKIYISALTQLNIDEHNRIPTTDGRLIRRMVRDARTRGTSARETIRMWPSVRRGEEGNIFPFQEEADVMFNSAAVYELAVLKQYAEPILFQIPKDCPEYLEAKRLLKFLDYVQGVSSEMIPQNSIVREFIGGSCFRV